MKLYEIICPSKLTIVYKWKFGETEPSLSIGYLLISGDHHQLLPPLRVNEASPIIKAADSQFFAKLRMSAFSHQEMLLAIHQVQVYLV